MPELPEVETTRRGVRPHIEQRRIVDVVVRERRLRWPLDEDFEANLRGQRAQTLDRRGKYLLLRLEEGTLLLHLGMSGSLRIVSRGAAPRPHDHVDLIFDNARVLRFHDPRRFGCMVWVEGDTHQHPLLRSLGPEPLEGAFDAAYLYRLSRGRRASVKQFLMDGRVVVGVGNIYANEALFMAGIDPRRPAGRVALARYEALVARVREVLTGAIEQGGTTLRDYVNEEGAPGYFSLKLRVYGRTGEACSACSGPIRQVVLGQRGTFYCPICQH